MRAELINEVTAQVRGFEHSYAPRHARRRLIYEALSPGVQYLLNNGVDGDIAKFGEKRTGEACRLRAKKA
jgi:hypothetical protein